MRLTAGSGAMHLSDQGRNDIENNFRRPVVGLADDYRIG